jgi:hypothetical protein
MRIQFVKTKKNQKNYDLIVDGRKIGESKKPVLPYDQIISIRDKVEADAIKK